MQEECYSEGQIINTFDSATGDSCVYLITFGKVEVLQEFQFDENNEDLTFCLFIFRNFFLNEKIQKRIQYQCDDKKKMIDQQNDGKKTIKILKVGEYFGECEFFTNSPLPYIVRSQKYTTVAKINTSKFIEIVKKNKQDYQKYQEIKHRIQLNKETYAISTKCLICSSYYHHFIDCSVTHYFKRSKILLFKYIHSPFQQRNDQFIRKREKQQHQFDNGTSTQKVSMNEDDENTSYIENEFNYGMDYSQQQIQSTQHISQKYINKNMNIETETIEEVENDDESNKYNYPNKSSLENVNQIINNSKKDQQYVKSNTFGDTFRNNSQVSKLAIQRQSLRQSLLNRRLSYDKKEQFEKPIFKERIQKQTSINIFQEQGQQAQIAQKTQNKYSVFELLKKQINDTTQQIDSNSSENEQNQQASIQEINQRVPSLSLSQRNSLQQAFKQYPLFNQQYQMNSLTYGFETLLKMKWDTSIYYWEFDKKCEFLYFFPHHNFKHVFKKIMKKHIIWKDKKRQGFRKSFQLIPNTNSIK
ncbi:cyclic nucleotide-binding domain protein (macronuclear) [Tetrahymena thermophila SB210]|uniref:Cyclic nucleotide-binding domain protein n=1 Tax=Tetrahymena thermophila (strain SB210) TaxID=312017 RepID=I7MMB9_TETTS|nr:cyclic nucleotide-binding domain protein [Tetrahymena thermophila SB210]EAS04553.2 cyclic nucleotide-binding domain protein [Tetrahymena thermophila SB210]|eukprot:XP_001024798.2 cyclic nucleotide-binding domain protein [Tetrahymena thermophila SB210]